MNNLPPGMTKFKVIRPHDVAQAEKAAAKEARRKKQSQELDDYLTRDFKMKSFTSVASIRPRV